jgi:hypothetical protein
MKTCKKCNSINSDDSVFCINCGSKLEDDTVNEMPKTTLNNNTDTQNNTQNTNDQNAQYFNYNYSYNSGFAGQNQVNAEQFEQMQKQYAEETLKRKRKALFALSLVGLLLCYIFGIGALMCLPVGIISLIEYNKCKSSTLLWSVFVSLTGFIIGTIYFLFIL